MTRTPAKRSSSRSLANLAPDEVKSVVDQYTGLHDANSERRKERYQSLVNNYYGPWRPISMSSAGGSPGTLPPSSGARASRRRCSGTSVFLPIGCP